MTIKQFKINDKLNDSGTIIVTGRVGRYMNIKSDSPLSAEFLDWFESHGFDYISVVYHFGSGKYISTFKAFIKEAVLKRERNAD